MNFNLPEDPVEGIVLRTFPCRDTDLVLRVLTRTHGKIPVLARGARRRTKKMPVSLDLFDTGLFTIIPGRGSLPVLELFTPACAMRKLRENLGQLSCASTLCESYDLLTPEYGEESGELYRSCTESLAAVNGAQSTKEALRATVWGIASLLLSSGYLDPAEEIVPSAKKLVQLLDRVEQFAEKPLLSKSMLISVASGLRPSELGAAPSVTTPDSSLENRKE